MSNPQIPPLDYANPPPRGRRLVQLTLAAVIGLGVMGSLLAMALFGVRTTTVVTSPAPLGRVAPATVPTTLPAAVPAAAAQ